MHRLAFASLLVVLVGCGGPATTTVSGKVVVVDQQDSSGISVGIGGRIVLTDAAGAFSIKLVKGEHYTLSASAPFILEGSVTQDIDATKVDKLAVPDIHVHGAGTVTGTVTLGAATGNAGISVLVVGARAIATTDDAGNFTLDGAPAGAQTLQAVKNGYRVGTAQVNVPFKASVAATALVLMPGGVAATLTGRVQLPNGQDPTGAVITASDVGATTTTQADGSFSLTLSEGVHDLLFQKGLYQATLHSVLTFGGRAFVQTTLVNIQPLGSVMLVQGTNVATGSLFVPPSPPQLTGDTSHLWWLNQSSAVRLAPKSGSPAIAVTGPTTSVQFAKDGINAIVQQTDNSIRIVSLGDGGSSLVLHQDAMPQNGYAGKLVLAEDGIHHVYRTGVAVTYAPFDGGTLDLQTGLGYATSAFHFGFPRSSVVASWAPASGAPGGQAAVKFTNLLSGKSTTTNAIASSIQEPPDGGVLVFYQDHDATNNFGTLVALTPAAIDANQAPTTLHSQVSNATAVVLSPDGTRVLFQAYNSGSTNWEFTNARTDGSGSLVLSTLAATLPAGPPGSTYSFSPQSNHLAYFDSSNSSVKAFNATNVTVQGTYGAGSAQGFTGWAGNEKFMYAAPAFIFNGIYLAPAAGGAASVLLVLAPGSGVNSVVSQLTEDANRFFDLVIPSSGPQVGSVKVSDISDAGTPPGAPPITTLEASATQLSVAPDGQHFTYVDQTGLQFMTLTSAPTSGTPICDLCSVVQWLDGTTAIFYRQGGYADPIDTTGYFVAHLP